MWLSKLYNEKKPYKTLYQISHVAQSEKPNCKVGLDLLIVILEGDWSNLVDFVSEWSHIEYKLNELEKQHSLRQAVKENSDSQNDSYTIVSLNEKDLVKDDPSY